MERAVVVLSGRIESLVIAAMFREKHASATASGVFVNYGQQAALQEERAAWRIARKYGIVLEVVELNVPFFADLHLIDTDTIIYSELCSEELTGFKVEGNPRSHVVPYRNLIVVSLAAALASRVGASEVWVGFDYNAADEDLGTVTRDKSPKFVEHVNRALEEAKEGTAVSIVAPLQGTTKIKTVLLGEKLGVDWSSSWSCYNRFSLPCGVCPQCVTRKETFAKLSIDEGVAYCSLEFLQAQMAG